MKIIFRSALVAALLIATSCGKDDDGGNSSQLEEQAEQLEQTPLEANTVADNVLIEGGSKMEGMPPTPNEAISLDISKAEKTAFLNEGFNIPVSSDGDIVGAYLQFKDNDGNLADNYYDINLSQNTSFKRILENRDSKKRSPRQVSKVDEANLDIDFNNRIEPGTFCYAICVYDGNGNISAPSDVCITVESWGGNNAITGKWDLVKQEYKYGDTEGITVVGEEDCNGGSYFIMCADETTYTYNNCYTADSWELIFNADGTYKYIEKGRFKGIDTFASSDACEPVYEEETNDIYKSDGNWAYSAGENRLVLVEYSWSEEEDGIVTGSETFAPGEAYLLYDGAIELEGNSLKISDIVDDIEYEILYLSKN